MAPRNPYSTTKPIRVIATCAVETLGETPSNNTSATPGVESNQWPASVSASVNERDGAPWHSSQP